jgi:DnaK suppressor protein
MDESLAEEVKRTESLEPPTIPVHRLFSGQRGDMQQSDFNEYRVILQTLRQELEQPMRQREEIAVDNSPDALDQVQHAADRDLAIRKLEFDSSRLRSVKDAIRRIEDGTYGACLRCDAEISAKRLKAVPWTEYCLECQDTAENDRTQTRNEFIPRVATIEEPELV